MPLWDEIYSWEILRRERKSKRCIIGAPDSLGAHDWTAGAVFLTPVPSLAEFWAKAGSDV